MMSNAKTISKMTIKPKMRFLDFCFFSSGVKGVLLFSMINTLTHWRCVGKAQCRGCWPFR